MEIKQCKEVRAKETFNARTGRRRIHVAAGDLFWIASTATYATNFGVVELARKGKSVRYPFNLENFNRLFEEV